MTTYKYKQAVIKLFQSGQATPEQWDEMASAVLFASQDSTITVRHIDDNVYGPEVELLDKAGN